MMGFHALLAALALSSMGGAALAGAACEGAPSTAKLRLVIDAVHSSAGQMTATLYPDDPSVFLKANGALKVWRNPVAAPVTTMCIWLPGPGTYAVAVYQDVNGNLKWDHPGLGSIEPFGFSNNPTIFFSQPSLKSTQFAAGAGETVLHIKLNHR